MRQKEMTGARSVLSLLIFVCFVCVLSGCSSLPNFLGLNQEAEPPTDARAGTVKQFFSHVRAPSGNPDSHYLLGRYYVESGRYKQALAEFEKTAAIKPDYVKAYNGIAVCYDHLKEYEKAAAYYEIALALAPDLDYIHNNMGYSFNLQGAYDSAIREYSRAIEINAGNTRFHNNLASVLSKMGRAEQAAREFESAGNTVMVQNQRRPAAGMAIVSHERRETAAETMAPDSRITIEISNGNGINNMARNVAAYLRTKGFNVVRCTNAASFYHISSEIHYQKEAREVGSQIAREVPEIGTVKEVKKLGRPNLKVKVIIGKDLTDKKRFFEEGRG